MLELGVEGIKADDGEGYYFPDDVRFADGRTRRRGRPGRYGRLYRRSMQRALDEVHPGDAACCSAARAGPGQQAVGITWGGDQASDFWSLRTLVAATLTRRRQRASRTGRTTSAATSASGWSRAARRSCSLRWVQFGCFTPLMHAHGRFEQEAVDLRRRDARALPRVRAAARAARPLRARGGGHRGAHRAADHPPAGLIDPGRPRGWCDRRRLRLRPVAVGRAGARGRRARARGGPPARRLDRLLDAGARRAAARGRWPRRRWRASRCGCAAARSSSPTRPSTSPRVSATPRGASARSRPRCGASRRWAARACGWPTAPASAGARRVVRGSRARDRLLAGLSCGARRYARPNPARRQRAAAQGVVVHRRRSTRGVRVPRSATPAWTRRAALIEEAGAAGARLIVFPETFLPGLSVLDLDAHAAPRARRCSPSCSASRVELPSDATRRIGQAARRARHLGVHGPQRARGRHALQHAGVVRRRRPPRRAPPQAAADERRAHDLGSRRRARRLRPRHAARAPRRPDLLRAHDGPQPLRADGARPADPRRRLAGDLRDDRRPQLGATSTTSPRPRSSTTRMAAQAYVICVQSRIDEARDRRDRVHRPAGQGARGRRLSRDRRARTPPTSPGRTATTRRSSTARSTSGSSRSRSSSPTRPATTRGPTSSPSASMPPPRLRSACPTGDRGRSGT